MNESDAGSTLEVATFGGGCFWCTEAVFQEVEGVEHVESGYAGGVTVDPTYRQVCSGETGHAEVVQVHFDPAVISYGEVLEIFFLTHDPTTPDQQGADVGTQYRSIILFADDGQRRTAEDFIVKLEENDVFDAPIVTQLEALETFYPAEDYHQNYYRQNPGQGYCSVVINPKLAKFRANFADRLKGGA